MTIKIIVLLAISLSAIAKEDELKGNLDARQMSESCYPIADLPNSHGALVLQKMLGETDFECAVFTHSYTYSLVMIRKHEDQMICEERTMNALDFIRDNEIKKELITTAKIQAFQREIDEKSASILIKTLKQQVVKAVYPVGNESKNFVCDGYICDVYVKGEKNELEMYSSRFKNPAVSARSCSILSDAISLYVKTANVTYRSLELDEIVKYLLDDEAGRTDVDDPVLKRKSLNSDYSNDTQAMPENANDSDGLIAPSDLKKMFEEK